MVDDDLEIVGGAALLAPNRHCPITGKELLALQDPVEDAQECVPGQAGGCWRRGGCWRGRGACSTHPRDVLMPAHPVCPTHPPTRACRVVYEREAVLQYLRQKRGRAIINAGDCAAGDVAGAGGA